MSVTKKEVLKYALLPGFIPRFRELAGGGAGYIALYLAQIYAAVRLLPRDHPYLNPANRGRFGVHNVVVAAAGRLKFKKENCDQIIIFFLMLIGLLIFIMQFVLLGLTLFMQAAHASSGMPTNFAGFFITPAAAGGGPNDDIAFVLLDRVFGVPQLFLDAGGNPSCVEDGTVGCFLFINSSANPEGPYPWPFHLALRAMMQFYSIGLLVIGLIIFLYFTVTVVMETAQDGVPFGRRFNHVWAPIRMVVSLGLLIPVANGLNAAQYITLYAAYWGSGFATNGWNLFITNALPNPAVDTPGGPLSSLVVTPNQPEMSNLAQFYTVAATCYAAYWELISDPLNGIDIEAYLVKPGGSIANHRLIPLNASLDFATAANFMDYHDLDIVYGSCTAVDASGNTQDCDSCGAGCVLDYQGEKGGVKPLCGEVVIPLEGSMDTAVATNPDAGAYFIAQQWWELTYASWLGSAADDGTNCHTTDLTGRSCWSTTPGAAPWPTDTTCGISDPSVNQSTMSGNGNYPDTFSAFEQWGYCFVDKYAYDPPDINAPIPSNADLKWMVNSDPLNLGVFNLKLGDIIQDAVGMNVLTTEWKYVQARLGWAGAGLWYHNIARINGSLINALADIPVVVNYPSVMEDIKKSRAKSDKNASGPELYRPVAATDQHPEGTKTDSQGDKIAQVLWQSFDAWNSATSVKPSSNWLTDIIKAVTGQTGLLSLTDPKNINVHPLALLVGMGGSMKDAAIDSLGYVGAGALIIRATGDITAQQVLNPFFTFAFTIGIISLGIGCLLYYIVPFMPFVYYFFAVGTWIKSIFEAMVGVPLWALAHIHIDGDGLPGTYALGGYLMIMEIFLRPILIVFGLLASYVFFAAQVRVLHDIWMLVTSNLTGFDTTAGVVMPAGDTHSLTYYRDAVDQFFFTVIYAVVVYMLGMSSFKLITLIPSKVMRWIGTSVDAFDDGGSQVAEQFKGTMSQGTTSTLGKVGSTFSDNFKSPSKGTPLDAAKEVGNMGGSGVQK